MAQGLLPFKYEEEKKSTGMTAMAGLPLYLELGQKLGLTKSIDRHIQVRKNAQGLTDSQMVLSLILLNLAGGSCVDNLRVKTPRKNEPREAVCFGRYALKTRVFAVLLSIILNNY